MIVVGICDGEKKIRERLHGICENVIIEADVNAKVIEFESGKEMLDYPGELTVLMLGLELPGMGGMSVMRKFREMGKHLIILYDAGCTGGVSDMRTLAFVEMECAGWELPILLEDAFRRAARFTVLEGGIDSRDIVYIKAEQPYCRIFLANGLNRMFRSSMNLMEDKLKNAGFVRVHRSYLANLSYIENVLEDTVCMKNVEIPVAARRRSVVRKTYGRFCEETGVSGHKV